VFEIISRFAEPTSDYVYDRIYVKVQMKGVKAKVF